MESPSSSANNTNKHPDDGFWEVHPGMADGALIVENGRIVKASKLYGWLVGHTLQYALEKHKLKIRKLTNGGRYEI